MGRAVAVGERDLILGFQGVGFEIAPVKNGEQLMTELMKLARDTNVGLVLVTESIAAESPTAIEEFRQRCATMLTLIPTHEGSRHASFEEMRKTVERSLGVDILGKE